LSRSNTILAVLLALAIGPYFIDLGGSSIWDANEAFYVETPREMMEKGDYVTPSFNYEPRLNKPILSYWIVAGFYQVFGVSVGVQRVPIAIGGLLLIATAFFLAWAAVPAANATVESTDRRVEAGLWAAAGLAVTPRLLMFARRIFIDVYISVFMGLTLLCFVLAERYPERRRLFLPLMYVAVGLGVLTKGPIAIVLPGAVFAVYLIVGKELPRVRSMMIPTGTAIVLAIIAPWCVALYTRHGWMPLIDFIMGENVARYTAGIGVQSDRGPFFYIPVLLSDAFPWSPFLFAVVAAWWKDRRLADRAADPSCRVGLLLWLWIVVIVLFFTASAAKQDLYIFPVVPAVAALAAVTFARDLTAAVRWITCLVGMIVAIAGGGVLYLLGPGSVYVLEGASAMGTVGVVGGLAVSALAITNRRRAGLVAILATFVVLEWIFVLRVLPGFERYKPVPGFAGTLAARIKADDVLLTYDEALPSLVFYLRRHVDSLFLPDEVFERFRSGRTVYAVMSPENYRGIGKRIGVPTCIIDRRPTFDVKLKNMLGRESLPELLLITNKCNR
jgi:4-amino-4-deoxy-L-arabinose transferase-like glycosyltransferase